MRLVSFERQNMPQKSPRAAQSKPRESITIDLLPALRNIAKWPVKDQMFLAEEVEYIAMKIRIGATLARKGGAR